MHMYGFTSLPVQSAYPDTHRVCVVRSHVLLQYLYDMWHSMIQALGKDVSLVSNTEYYTIHIARKNSSLVTCRCIRV